MTLKKTLRFKNGKRKCKMHFYEKKILHYLQMWNFFCIFAARLVCAKITNKKYKL